MINEIEENEIEAYEMEIKLNVVLKIVGIICLIFVTIFIILLTVVIIMLYYNFVVDIIPEVGIIVDAAKNISKDVNAMAAKIEKFEKLKGFMLRKE